MHRAVPDLTQPPVRWPRRWRGRLGLLLGVLLLHASLLDRLTSGPAPGTSLPRPAGVQASMQVRSLVAPPPSAGPVQADVGAARQATAPFAVTPPAVVPPARLTAKPAAAPGADAPAPTDPDRVAAGLAPEAGTQPATAAAVTPPATAAAVTEDHRLAAAIDAPLASASLAEAAIPEAGQPPPVYATTLPAPVLLHYRLQSGGQVGEATLDWRHDGQRYALLFDARGGRAQPLIEQTSQGGFDAAGLAPLRFTDRRRGRGQRAANFRRDIGRIGFSGPQLDYPAWPGAQDRLSWLAQLAAIQSAMAMPLTAITLFVVDVRGGDWWRWVAMGAENLPTPLGLLSAQRWQREPDRLDRPDGQRVEVWLDPARGHWPVQMRFTSLRSGELFELHLTAEPGLPPALPPALPP